MLMANLMPKSCPSSQKACEQYFTLSHQSDQSPIRVRVVRSESDRTLSSPSRVRVKTQKSELSPTVVRAQSE